MPKENEPENILSGRKVKSFATVIMELDGVLPKEAKNAISMSLGADSSRLFLLFYSYLKIEAHGKLVIIFIIWR